MNHLALSLANEGRFYPRFVQNQLSMSARAYAVWVREQVIEESSRQRRTFQVKSKQSDIDQAVVDLVAHFAAHNADCARLAAAEAQSNDAIMAQMAGRTTDLSDNAAAQFYEDMTTLALSKPMNLVVTSSAKPVEGDLRGSSAINNASHFIVGVEAAKSVGLATEPLTIGEQIAEELRPASLVFTMPKQRSYK